MNIRANTRRTLRVAAIAVLAAASSWAQAVFGNIAGTGEDASGGLLPNAKIEIKDLDRGAVYNVVSSGDGNFSQMHLLAGRYQVTVQEPGFGTYTANATVQ